MVIGIVSTAPTPVIHITSTAPQHIVGVLRRITGITIIKVEDEAPLIPICKDVKASIKKVAIFDSRVRRDKVLGRQLCGVIHRAFIHDYG